MFGFGGGNKADATINVNYKGDKAEKGLKSLTKTIKTVVSAFVIHQLARYTWELGELGAQAISVGKNFRSFANQQGRAMNTMMKKLRKATMGMVSDMELQQNAMKAMISGVSFDDMITTMEYVTKYAAATGTNATQKMATVMTGMARKSAMFFDDVGIQVMGSKDVIGDAVDQMREKMGQFAMSEEDAIVQAIKMQAEWANVKAEFGKTLQPVFEGLVNFLRVHGIPALKEFMSYLPGMSPEDRREKADLQRQVDESLLGTLQDQKKIIEANIEVAKTSQHLTQQMKNETVKTLEGQLWGVEQNISLVEGRIERLKKESGFTEPVSMDLDGGGDGKKKAAKEERDDWGKHEDARLARMREYEAQHTGITAEEYDRRAAIRKQARNIGKTEDEIWYSEQLAALEEQFSGIEGMEREHLALREELTKEYEKRIADTKIAEAQRAAREQERIMRMQIHVAMVASDTFTNFQVTQLKQRAKTQEEFDKKMAEIQRAAAVRQQAILAFQKMIALGKALASLGAATGESAAHGAVKGGAAGAIAEAVVAAAELGFIVSEIAAIQTPTPKFRAGRLGKRNRGGFGDVEAAMVDPAETIVPAAQSAMHEDSLRAIVTNTANTASGMRKMSGGNTYVFNAVPAEQMLNVLVATERRGAVGRRL